MLLLQGHARPTPIPVCPDDEVTWESKSQGVLVAFSLFSLDISQLNLTDQQRHSVCVFQKPHSGCEMTNSI